ncbi:MAG: glutamine-hydrolyzing carbamoyl-phosphate synthase small subunit [bacterium]|nr:glutamine-hydrolyzing carbamoyl-phosphate synthase small subunit [bacterium]
MATRLLLADGKAFYGEPLGYQGEAFAEVVFNTAMTGYQEILTDPSYFGQMVVMTYSQIGNYGVNKEDIESRRIFASGFIIREYSPVVSNWRSQESLDSYLKRYEIPGITEIDTRALTRHIRDNGAQMAVISNSDEPEDDLLGRLRKHPSIVGRDVVKDVTVDKPYDWQIAVDTDTKHRVAVYDFGVKYSILNNLSELGCAIKIFPADTSAEDIMEWKPDGVFLSNGPGDPEPLESPIKNVRKLLGKIPVFGICLGHQILGLASGSKTSKLKFGHHGANHPVKNLLTDSIEITAQNHGFVVDPDTLKDSETEITHLNLNDGTLEGFRHRTIPAFSVQYHPEASPGPHDSRYLFNQFLNLMENKSYA